MRILLDECVPVQVRNALVGHDVATAQTMGWTGISNGELLQRAEQGGFDLFVVEYVVLGALNPSAKDGDRRDARPT